MSDQIENALLVWEEGEVPRAIQFDDTYYGTGDGLAEAKYVYLAGNDLPQRFTDGFHIAELGFGTGLNLLAAWQAWEELGMTSPLRFTSFEAFPMNANDMQRALSRWPRLTDKAQFLIESGGQIDHPTLKSNVIIGDANKTLPNWTGIADAWFLDGFAPSKNPELWGANLMKEVANHTLDQGTVSSFTSAGFVRENLKRAGFDVTRVAGYGRKRHMTVGSIRKHNAA